MRYEVLRHSSHTHDLQLQDTKRLFTCDGCKEHGFGASYGCEWCTYDLHKDCARHENTLPHPFFKGCTFTFMEAPPGPHERVCDACGRDVNGFVYHCRNKGWDLHPRCAKLGKHLKIIIDQEQVMLHLHDKVKSKCGRCGLRKAKKGVTGWSYVSTCKNYHFHVACIKDIIVGVCERLYLDPSVGEINDATIGQELVLPSTELVHRGHGGGWSKRRKYMRIAKAVIHSLISIFLQDPFGLVIGLVAAGLELN